MSAVLDRDFLDDPAEQGRHGDRDVPKEDRLRQEEVRDRLPHYPRYEGVKPPQIKH